jgi:hypothetical protein
MWKDIPLERGKEKDGKVDGKWKREERVRFHVKGERRSLGDCGIERNTIENLNCEDGYENRMKSCGGGEWWAGLKNRGR